ncbi:Aldo-keto reductase YhdN [Streptomyces sp. enrichment culture]|uniref:aldo/keto reductase n=1 Tax=Streptomyces sp. enrichment culture TaxID=1795815 RepID=UPI003F56C048
MTASFPPSGSAPASSRVPLGTTGMTISRVGLGTWSLGSTDWGPQDDTDSIATIGEAVGSGVNWIDTAAAYGLGHSERVVGRALAALAPHERPYVFTKCGVVPDERGLRKVMTPASVRTELENSLRRLGVDHIDLYQVHWPGDGKLLAWGPVTDDPGAPDLGTPLEEYWQTMADLKREGKVRAIGLSNHGVDELERAAAIAPVDAVQPPFSALDRGTADVLAWCARSGAGAIVYQALKSGLLTGACTAERVAALPETDWRRQAPDFTTALHRNLAVADTLGKVAARHGVTTAAVAIAWVLAWPGVTGAIIGARRPGQAADWAAAADLRLGEDDRREISQALRTHVPEAGPVHP